MCSGRFPFVILIFNSAKFSFGEQIANFFYTLLGLRSPRDDEPHAPDGWSNVLSDGSSFRDGCEHLESEVKAAWSIQVACPAVQSTTERLWPASGPFPQPLRTGRSPTVSLPIFALESLRLHSVIYRAACASRCFAWALALNGKSSDQIAKVPGTKSARKPSRRHCIPYKEHSLPVRHIIFP